MSVWPTLKNEGMQRCRSRPATFLLSQDWPSSHEVATVFFGGVSKRDTVIAWACYPHSAHGLAALRSCGAWKEMHPSRICPWLRNWVCVPARKSIWSLHTVEQHQFSLVLLDVAESLSYTHGWNPSWTGLSSQNLIYNEGHGNASRKRITGSVLGMPKWMPNFYRVETREVSKRPWC